LCLNGTFIHTDVVATEKATGCDTTNNGDGRFCIWGYWSVFR